MPIPVLMKSISVNVAPSITNTPAAFMSATKKTFPSGDTRMSWGMPPRESQRVNTSLDSVWASGPLGKVHCAIYGACNYKQTGLLQAHAAYHLIHGQPKTVGFASGCQAFGHRELLGVLQSFGLVGQPQVTSSFSHHHGGHHGR